MKNENKLLLPMWLIVVFLGFVVLYIGKSIIITLVFTSILLFIFSWIYSFFTRYLKSHIFSLVLTAGVFVSFFLVIGFIITSQIDNFSRDITKVGEWVTQLSSTFDFIPNSFSEIDIVQLWEKIDFAGIWKNALWAISWIVGWLSTVGFLLIFLMLEKNIFAKKMRDILPDREEKKFFW